MNRNKMTKKESILSKHSSQETPMFSSSAFVPPHVPEESVGQTENETIIRLDQEDGKAWWRQVFGPPLPPKC